MKNRRWLLALLILVAAGALILLWPGAPEPGADDQAAAGGGTDTTAEAEGEPAPAAARRQPGARQFGGLGRAAGPAREIDEDDEPAGPLLLEGQVLDSQDLPAAGATVTIDTRPRRETRSGPDGTFQFSGLLGRRYRLAARRADSVAGPVLHQLTEKSPPAILRLRRGGSVEVWVSAAADGRPLPGAEVELRENSNRTARCDQAGRASFSGVASGWHTVVARAPGYAPARKLAVMPATPGPRPVQVRLQLQAGAELSGLVRDEQGQPVAGARVLAVNERRFFDLQSARRDGAVSDEQGQFRIPALPAGSYRLEASHPDYAPGRAGPVRLDGRRPRAGVEIVLESGGVISGRVVDTSGAPVAWAAVRVGTAPEGRGRRGRRRGLRRRGTTADERGEFTIKGLPRQKLLVVALGAEASSTTQEVDLGTQARVADLVLRLDVGGRIAGQVVTSSGEPVAEVLVNARPDFWKQGFSPELRLRGRSQALTDGGGNFEFQGLSEGSYRLWASRSGDDFRGWRQRGVEARTGDENVRIVLDPEGGLRGRVQLATGGVPESYTVTVDLPPGTEFGGSAEFELVPVAAGKHRVAFSGPGFAETVLEQVEVQPGQITDLGLVTLAAGRLVGGRVRDGTGRPIAGATVVLARQLIGDTSSLTMELGEAIERQMGLQRTSSDDSGDFRFPGIGPEEQVLVAEHPDFGRSLPAKLPPGNQDAEIELVLEGFGSVTGRVTAGGQPAADIMVSAVAAGNAEQVVLAQAGEDGSYRFEKLPAGEHRISATRRVRGLGGRAESRLVTVRAGEQTRLDIDIPLGQVELTVDVAGVDGAAIKLAQVLLLPGQVQVSKAAELNRLATSTAGALMSAFWNPEKPAVFKEVIEGQYSACIVPLDGDLSDPAFLMKLRKYRLQLDVHCRPLEVAPAPAQQRFTAVVPPMSPFPTEDEAPAQQ